MEKEFEFNLGQIVTDYITEISGPITARNQNIGYGNEYCISQNVNGEIKSIWIHEARLAPAKTS